MLAIGLGLASGLLWGTADFFGGLESRRLPALAVALWSQLVGGIALLAVLLVSGGGAPGLALLWGVAAGTFGGTALMFFYKGLSVGTMSIVAPVSACGAVIPVVYAIARGDSPGTLALAGIVAALCGIVLVSLPSGPSDGAGQARPALLYALFAAVGFGLFFVFIERGSAVDGASVFAVITATRVGSLAMLGGFVLIGRQAAPYPGPRLLVVGAVGVADTTANVLFAHASTLGNLGVVGVLASLYPVATVVLARAVLEERLGRVQAGGVALALAGVGLLAAA